MRFCKRVPSSSRNQKVQGGSASLVAPPAPYQRLRSFLVLTRSLELLARRQTRRFLVHRRNQVPLQRMLRHLRRVKEVLSPGLKAYYRQFPALPLKHFPRMRSWQAKDPLEKMLQAQHQRSSQESWTMGQSRISQGLHLLRASKVETKRKTTCRLRARSRDRSTVDPRAAGLAWYGSRLLLAYKRKPLTRHGRTSLLPHRLMSKMTKQPLQQAFPPRKQLCLLHFLRSTSPSVQRG